MDSECTLRKPFSWTPRYYKCYVPECGHLGLDQIPWLLYLNSNIQTESPLSTYLWIKYVDKIIFIFVFKINVNDCFAELPDAQKSLLFCISCSSPPTPLTSYGKRSKCLRQKSYHRFQKYKKLIISVTRYFFFLIEVIPKRSFNWNIKHEY